MRFLAELHFSDLISCKKIKHSFYLHTKIIFNRQSWIFISWLYISPWRKTCGNFQLFSNFLAQIKDSSATSSHNTLNMPFNSTDILEACETVTFLGYSTMLTLSLWFRIKLQVTAVHKDWESVWCKRLLCDGNCSWICWHICNNIIQHLKHFCYLWMRCFNSTCFRWRCISEWPLSDL